MNPITSLLFGETGLSAIQIPTLIVASSADKTTPALAEQIAGFSENSISQMASWFCRRNPLKRQRSKYNFTPSSQANTVITGDEVVGDQAVSIRNYIKAVSLATVAQLTSEADKYAVFITPEYAQFASTSAIPVRLVTEISPENNAVVQTFIQRNK